MKARRLDDDRLLVPVRVEGPGVIIGDGMVGVRPDHSDYAGWLPYIEETDAQPARRPAERPGGSNPETR